MENQQGVRVKKHQGNLRVLVDAWRWADNGFAIAPRCLVQNLRDAAMPHDAEAKKRESQVT